MCTPFSCFLTRLDEIRAQRATYFRYLHIALSAGQLYVRKFSRRPAGVRHFPAAAENFFAIFILSKRAEPVDGHHLLNIQTANKGFESGDEDKRLGIGAYLAHFPKRFPPSRSTQRVLSQWLLLCAGKLRGVFHETPTPLSLPSGDDG